MLSVSKRQEIDHLTNRLVEGLIPLSVVVLAFALDGCECKWECKGPFDLSGAVRHVLVDPVNSQRLYAATENGGLWVLDDVEGDAGWRPLTDELENLQMRGIAKSSFDEQYVVTANALGYVYHSKNHGQTWTRVTNDSFGYIRRILIAEGLTRVPAGNYTRLAKETKLWVGCRTGLYRMRLVNDQWQETTKLFPSDGTDADVLDAVKHPINQDILYIGVRDQGVLVTDDGGASWNPSAAWGTFGDPGFPMIKLAVSANGGRVVAKLGRKVVIKDGTGTGGSWNTTTTVPFGSADRGGSDIGYRGNYSGNNREWSHAVAVHPTDPDIIAVGQAELFLSDDGGGSWTAVAAGHEDTQSLAFSPSGDRLYIANDGGVFFRTTSDTDLLTSEPTESINTDLVTLQFYRVAVHGNIAVGDADHQGIRGTKNLAAAKPTWNRAHLGSSGYGNNGLENNFVVADPETPGRFFVPFDTDLLRLRFPGTGTNGSAEDLLAFNDVGVPLRPYMMRTDNNSVFNQLNYAVNTIAIDPRPKSHTILASVHETMNTQFGVYITSDGDVDPAGGPRKVCDKDSSSSLGSTGVTPRRSGGATVWDTFTCTAATDGTVFYTQLVTGMSAWRATSLTGLGVPVASIVFSPLQSGRVYALDEAGTVWTKHEVNDDAENWDDIGAWDVPAGDYARQIITGVDSPHRLYAISHTRFVRSTDGGATWNPAGAATLPNDQQLNSVCAHPDNGEVLFMATSRDVLMSKDRGTTWRTIGKRIPNAPVMHLFTEDDYLYAVTFGRGLWRMALHPCPCQNR